MKKGDVVTVNDFSWFATLGIYTCDYVKDCTKRYRILDTGCYFPLERRQPEKYRSDTTIQAVDSGEVLVIHGAFLRLAEPTHEVMIDMKSTGCAVLETGQVIEISDELYKEIKRGSQS